MDKLIWLIAIIGFGFLLFNLAKKSRDPRQAGRKRQRVLSHYQKPNAEQLDAKIESILSRDPSFDFGKFAHGAATVFSDVRRAYSQGNLNSVRHFLSDGVHERFVMSIAMQQILGQHYRLHDVNVLHVEAVDFGQVGPFDEIQLRIEALVHEATYSPENQFWHGDREPQPIAEYWSFCRRQGARTHPNGGILAGHCPSCGAKLKVSDAGACEYCQTHVHGGEHDWILCEITQVSAGHTAIRDVPGLSEYRQVDPHFLPQQIEDRVSAMFWRVHARQLFHNDQLLADLSYFRRPDLVQAVKPGEPRQIFTDISLGAVELKGVRINQPAGFDQLEVHVRWAARQIEKSIPARLRPKPEQAGVYLQRFILQRRTGGQSALNKGWLSLHCEGCGAPSPISLEAPCHRCGREFEADPNHWQLATVEPLG